MTTKRLVSPEQLPDWVPCRVQAASDTLGWAGLAFRAYRHPAYDVEMPGIRDYLVVRYRSGCAGIHRRFEGRWSRAAVVPGDLSLLTRSETTHWHWKHAVDVDHVYLSEQLMSGVAQEMFDRALPDVRLHDLLKASDAAVHRCIEALAGEAAAGQPGSALCAQALGLELSVHLLRRFSSVVFRPQASHGGLSATQRRQVEDCIEASLHEPLTLESLAGVVHLGVCTFVRRFRQTFGDTPHAYLVKRRVERARELLQHGRMPLKQVAAACGFSDQAHMTRTLRSHLQTTPAALRRGG